jgi:hypothetical protein
LRGLGVRFEPVAKPPTLLQTANVRVTRLVFVVGVGFIAQITGALLTVALSGRLRPLLERAPFGWAFPVHVLLQSLWVLGVLPLLCYGAARVMELRPWRTAVGAALTGELFLLALSFLSTHLEGPWFVGLARGIAWASGVALTAWAVRRGTAAAAAAAQRAQDAAHAKKQEYDAFVRESERVADRVSAAKADPAAPADPK